MIDMGIHRIEQLETALQQHILDVLKAEPGIDCETAERVAEETASDFWNAMMDELEDE